MFNLNTTLDISVIPTTTGFFVSTKATLPNGKVRMFSESVDTNAVLTAVNSQISQATNMAKKIQEEIDIQNDNE